MANSCDALIISCIDFRFQKYIRDWLDKNMSGKTFDYVGYAGATKDMDTVLKQVDISVRLHNIKQVILMHHEDCGAYGAEGTPEKHRHDMRNTKTVVRATYPDVQVDMYYLHLDGTFEKVD